jgi:hypothetical protein
MLRKPRRAPRGGVFLLGARPEPAGVFRRFPLAADVFGQSLRAREGECELGTLAIGKRCQERISAIGWRGSGQFAESALDTLCVTRNRGRIDIVAF